MKIYNLLKSYVSITFIAVIDIVFAILALTQFTFYGFAEMSLFNIFMFDEIIINYDFRRSI